MTEKEKIALFIETSIESGNIYQMNGGFYVYNGLYANHMRQIANKLDEMNALLAKQIKEDLTGVTNQHQGVTNENQN